MGKNNHEKSHYSIRHLNVSIMYAKIENAVGQQKGVDKVKILFNASKVKADLRSDETSPDALKGY